MQKLLTIAFLLLCVGFVFGQDNAKPFTKDELLRLLEPAPGKRVEQGDLAGEIAARGIAFPADEKTLEEFRKVGARSFVIDAIKQAATDAARPKTIISSPSPTEDEIKTWSLERQAAFHAIRFIRELPNFIVTEIVNRSVQKSNGKDWLPLDKLEVELSFSLKSGEVSKLLKINDRPTSQSYESVGGSTSVGQFGLLLGAMMHPRAQTQFKELRKETYRGRQTMMYEFAVKKANSTYHVTESRSGRKLKTGYRGTIWIDIETARILRFEMSAEEIEPGFNVSMSEMAVDYDWITVAAKKFFLPVSAETIIGSDAERNYLRNVIEFRNYRVFETDIKIIEEKSPPK